MPVFVIRNQQGQFLNKQKEWQDSGDSRSLTRLKHHDEALNLVFELSSKDIYLRAMAVECEQDSSGNPIIVAQDVDEFPYPASAAAEQAVLDTKAEAPSIDLDAVNAANNGSEGGIEADAQDTEPTEPSESAIKNDLVAVDSERSATETDADASNEIEVLLVPETDEEAELAAALAEELAEQQLIKEEALT